ncbi:MAG: hypothetical protein ACD_20C00176G0012 [uncultured bacterium]|nr:MAG: hypothetical protein ACD_20C00176G0012 [uncultured bacterium]
MSNILNIVSTKIKENEIILESGLILAVESSLAVIVISSMFNIYLSMIS